MIFTGYEGPLQLLKYEAVQKAYEGYPVPGSIEEQINQLDSEKDAMNFEAVDIIYKKLDLCSRLWQRYAT